MTRIAWLVALAYVALAGYEAALATLYPLGCGLAVERCERCSFREHPGPCLMPRIIPAGTCGTDRNVLYAAMIATARRGAERKAARAQRAARSSANSRYGRERRKR